jgi:hypothetical protein
LRAVAEFNIGVGLRLEARPVTDILDTQEDPAISVGHSLGGIVISQAVDERPNKVRDLIDLCVFVPSAQLSTTSRPLIRVVVLPPRLQYWFTMFQVQIRSRDVKSDLPDLSLLNGVVATQILDAMRAAAAKLEAAGIRHALAGALAVGAYGYPRASKDVDFVVGDEAFTTHEGGIVTVNPEVPIRVGEIVVDPICIGPNEPHLVQALVQAPISSGIRILPIDGLVYMKLKSPRRKDAADIVELVKAGIDVAKVTAYLTEHAPNLVDKFTALVHEAEAE